MSYYLCSIIVRSKGLRNQYPPTQKQSHRLWQHTPQIEDRTMKQSLQPTLFGLAISLILTAFSVNADTHKTTISIKGQKYHRFLAIPPLKGTSCSRKLLQQSWVEIKIGIVSDPEYLRLGTWYMYPYGLSTHKLYSRNLPEAYGYKCVYTSSHLIWKAVLIELISPDTLVHWKW